MSQQPISPRFSLKDRQTSHDAWIDEFFSLRVAEPARLAGTTFLGTTKDTNFWSESVSGTGSVTQGSGIVTLETGVTANSSAQYSSVRIALWVPGASNHFRTVMRLGDTGAANNIRNWGMATATDGIFFQLNGTTLNIVTRIGSVDTVIPKASWDNPSFALDTNFHTYEIVANYTQLIFYIDGVLVHSMAPATALFSGTLNLPVLLQNNNSGGGTANVILSTGVAFISRIGKISTETKALNIVGAVTTTLKLSPGKLHNIVFDVGANAGTVTLFDNTTNSGTQLGSAGSVANAAPVSLVYDAPFQTGLTIVTTGASTNLTVVYE